MPDENVEKLFLQEKPTRALLFIGSMGKTYASVISKEIDSTFAHTTRILSKMEQCGLIRFTFEGRIKFVELTGYGRDVENALKEFRDIIAEEPVIEKAQEDESEKENLKKGEGEKASEEEGNEKLEQAEELDPLNAEILEKIKNLRSKIESIHMGALEQRDSKDAISRKLGPYSRDIKKLQNQIERADSPINETVVSALKESERLLESYLKS
jgi:DNA-binding MarR family transcriptional regulator